jgi:hypothetical protein
MWRYASYLCARAAIRSLWRAAPACPCADPPPAARQPWSSLFFPFFRAGAGLGCVSRMYQAALTVIRSRVAGIR